MMQAPGILNPANQLLNEAIALWKRVSNYANQTKYKYKSAKPVSFNAKKRRQHHRVVSLQTVWQKKRTEPNHKNVPSFLNNPEAILPLAK